MKQLYIVSLLALTSCASITNGSSQTVQIDTHPVRDATCYLANGEGAWSVKSPGDVEIHRAYSDLTIVCKKNGWEGKKVVSSTSGGGVWGSAAMAGIIGAGIDMASGAAYHYPDYILVKMEK